MDIVPPAFPLPAIERPAPLLKYGNGNILKPFLRKGMQDLPFSKLGSGMAENINLTADSIKIPKLYDVLNFIKAKKYREKVYIEIKSISSDHARRQLMNYVNEFKNEFEIALLSYKGDFINSFPDPHAWCESLKACGIKALSIGWHGNLCKKY